MRNLWDWVSFNKLTVRTRVFKQRDLLNALNAPNLVRVGDDYIVDDESHGTVFLVTGAAAFTITLPKAEDVPAGYTVRVINNVSRTGALTIEDGESDSMTGLVVVNGASTSNGSADHLTFGTAGVIGDWAEFVSSGSSRWFASGAGAAASSITFG